MIKGAEYSQKNNCTQIYKNIYVKYLRVFLFISLSSLVMFGIIIFGNYFLHLILYLIYLRKKNDII